MSKEQDIIQELKNNIEEIIKADELKVSIEPSLDAGWEQPDFIMKIVSEDWTVKFAGEILAQQSSSIFDDKLAQLKSLVSNHPEFLPLIVSPYLSPPRRVRCKEEGIFFIDLSGNVYLKYRSLFIERTGFPNRFPEKRRGRNPFSDKASLILRAMLEQSQRAWGVRELAQYVNLDPGFVSRMVRELEKRNYDVRSNSKLQIRSPKGILEDWIHEYNYKKNQEFRYFCLAKSPDEILDKLRNVDVSEQKIIYALGLHAGANLIAPYTVYNEVHSYVSSKDVIDFLARELNLKAAEQDANIIFLLPYYKHSVFYNKQLVNDLWVVSDLQLYLDLYNYPVRGLEQAEHLYAKKLKKLFES